MDQKILDHILNKDWEQAFKLLVKDYHQRVYWQIRRMVLIHEDADDIAQNVFIKIYQNLNSFKNESIFRNENNTSSLPFCKIAF